MSIYKGMLEACLITIDGNGEPIFPYFSESQIDNYVVNYLDKNISRYSKKYIVNTDYFDRDGLDDICHFNCKVLRISLNAKINSFLDYKKEQAFVVRSGEEL